MSDVNDLSRPTQSTTSGFVEMAAKSPVDGKIKPVDANNPLPVAFSGAATISGEVEVKNKSGTQLAVSASPRNCVGHQTITALSASTPATLTVPQGAVAALIQADGGTVRITTDGVTAPTATVGHRIDDGVFYPVDTSLSAVKLLAQSGTTTNVQVDFYDRA